MKTLGWLLLCLAALVALISFLHVGGAVSAIGTSPKILTIVIPGIILVALFAVPGYLLVAYSKKP